MKRLADQVTDLQLLYPRIYMACHVDHVRARSSESRISARDSGILAHLSVRDFRGPGKLAKHLRVSASTLSEALHNLVALGYVEFKVDQRDERRTEFRLSDKGLAAMKSSSVLDPKKVAALLKKLSPQKRGQVVEGLRILADAAL